jgi:hypothetical protein
MDGAVQELLAGRTKDPFNTKLVTFGNSRLVALPSVDDLEVRYFSCIAALEYLLYFEAAAEALQLA